MPYTTNPYLPKLRMEAVRLVQQRGWTMREVARHIRVEPSTVSRWVKLDPTGGWRPIPTQSSRPSHHPRELSREVVSRILELRDERKECAEILQHRLTLVGVRVSLSSVKRVLRRAGCSRFSKWKKWHVYPPRPTPEKPGVLIQIDSMRDGLPKEHLYAYALIDVCSRWAYAAPAFRAASGESSRFLLQAQTQAPFAFQTVQSDHGSEFSKWFTKVIGHRGIAHRHSRVRTPTDNAYVERFIQTLQKGCLNRIPRSLSVWQREIPNFLHYYNTERPHMALEYHTPLEVLRRY